MSPVCRKNVQVMNKNALLRVNAMYTYCAFTLEQNMKTFATVRYLAVPVLLLFLHAPQALAMGNNSTNSKTPDCPSGQVYDSTTQKCVPDKSSSLSDQDKTNYAYHLAKKGEYQAALNLLNTLKNSNTAEAWNYRGYATRKLGRTDEGIGYYQRSLALNPNYAKAREYLGEAWMVKGRPDLAKEQLNVIAGICGQTCEEYRDLQAAINGHPES
jgi:Putative Zn-dependent protease, contains TPR repeats